MHYKEIVNGESPRLEYCEKNQNILPKTNENVSLFMKKIEECLNLILELSDSSDSLYLFQSLLHNFELYPQIILPLNQTTSYIDLFFNHYILSNPKICKIILKLLKKTLENCPDSYL